MSEYRERRLRRRFGDCCHASTRDPKFVGGSLDGRERPAECLDQKADELVALRLERRGLPAAGVRGHLQPPPVDADTPQTSVRPWILVRAGLDDDEVGSPSRP